MNIIQSFFNKRITPQNLNYRGGYLSSFVFWLSIAYSCLLLKRNNPTLRLLFYGNETIVHILKDLFKLPYDKYYICTTSHHLLIPGQAAHRSARPYREG